MSVLEIANITDVLHQARLWIKKIQSITAKFTEVGNQRGKGRSCKTGNHLINGNLRELRLQSGLAQNWLTWRKAIRETPS